MPRTPWNSGWEQYSSSRPIPVTDGIASSKKRGAMADSWWSQRFIRTLESYNVGGRMERGRRYARAGQLASLEIRPGRISAKVQGSRDTPYNVEVRFAPPPAAAWQALQKALEAKVGFVARLLAGEVPPELEDACREVGISLFPARWTDLDASCSCPDWENPCKHLAAVLYVFADQLDADPWLLFAWRGRTREEILAHLQELSAGDPDDGLPIWWPLVAGRTDLSRARWLAPTPTPPDPPFAVLARLESLEQAKAIATAYGVLTTADDDDDGPS